MPLITGPSEPGGDNSNSFDNSAAAPALPQPNEYNGIVVSAGNDHIKTNINWSATKVPFVIGDQTGSDWFDIDSTGTLALGHNVILKFFSGGSISIATGGTLVTGSGDVFTSIHDSTRGGNTDDNATAPTASDLAGINVNGTCTTYMTEYYEMCM